MLKKGTLWPLCCVYKYGFEAVLRRVLGKKKKNHRVSKIVDNKGGLITFDNDR